MGLHVLGAASHGKEVLPGVAVCLLKGVLICCPLFYTLSKIGRQKRGHVEESRGTTTIQFFFVIALQDCRVFRF